MPRLAKVDNGIYFPLVFLSVALSYFVFDQRLAIAYTVLVVTDFVWSFFDKKVTLPLERSTTGRSRSIFIAIIALSFFLIASSIISSIIPSSLLITGEKTGFASIIQYASATIPDLSQSFLADFLGFALIAAFIETSFFFTRLPDLLTDLVKKYFRINVNKKDFLMFIFIAALFTLFHFVAKQFKAALLIATFIFGLISYWLVMHFGHAREALLLHSFNNGLIVIFEHFGGGSA